MFFCNDHLDMHKLVKHHTQHSYLTVLTEVISQHYSSHAHI